MDSLHTTSELETLDTWSKKLLSTYSKSTENNSNPIVEVLLVEFENFQTKYWYYVIIIVSPSCKN